MIDVPVCCVIVGLGPRSTVELSPVKAIENRETQLCWREPGGVGSTRSNLASMLWRLRLKNTKARASKSARPTNPPTTPPAIAPTFFDFDPSLVAPKGSADTVVVETGTLVVNVPVLRIVFDVVKVEEPDTNVETATEVWTLSKTDAENAVDSIGARAFCAVTDGTPVTSGEAAAATGAGSETEFPDAGWPEEPELEAEDPALSF